MPRKGLPELRRVNLFNTKVTDNGLECLKGVPQLERLEVGGATAVTEAGYRGPSAGVAEVQGLSLI